MEISRKRVLKLLHRQDWHVSRSLRSHAGNHEAKVRAAAKAARITQALPAHRPQAGAAHAAAQAPVSDPAYPTQPGPQPGAPQPRGPERPQPVPPQPQPPLPGPQK